MGDKAMRKANSGDASKVIEQILELSADAHIQRRWTAKDSPEFHKLTGAIAAYGKTLALLTALRRIQSQKNGIQRPATGAVKSGSLTAVRQHRATGFGMTLQEAYDRRKTWWAGGEG